MICSKCYRANYHEDGIIIGNVAYLVCPKCGNEFDETKGFIDRGAGAWECPKCHVVMKAYAMKDHVCKEVKP